MIEIFAKTLLVIAAIVLTVISVAVYRDYKRLNEFRKNLKTGDRVIVDDGIMVQEAEVISVKETWVQVCFTSGTIAGYGLKCVFPINFF